MGIEDIRKEIGGKIEDQLNKLLDTKVKDLGVEQLKLLGYKAVDKLVEKYGGPVLAKITGIAKEAIDKIDGEKDIADAAPAAPAAPATPVK